MLFMKRMLCATILFLSCVISFAQKQETRTLKIFSKVRALDRIIVVLQRDTESKVLLDPKGDVWNEEIKTTVSGGELNISSEGKFRDANIFCYVHYTQSITVLSVRSGGIIRTDSNEVLESKKLEINATADGFTNINIKVDELIVDAGSGSDIYIRGKAGKVTVYATSGAKVHLEDLECDDAIVSCVIGAKVWLTAKVSYKAKAGSGGKIYYYSEPSGNFERNRTTGGNVELITR